ncbi:MAG: omega-6 fatty acid desaturase (delta-12 desaturase) [Parvicellaceae bacterium]|jgi:omega-6 fatty acid desaturase (delta-12 desaturase)
MKEKRKIASYKASDLRAFLGLIIPFIIGSIAGLLIIQEAFLIYLIGELLLSFFFLQTFILLHECGHMNYFKSRSLNYFFGHFFGFLTMIPYFTWKHMHFLHHRWTGWRDKDPTTEKTVEPSESPIMRVVANVAWITFFPIFYLAYKLSNYWNLSKIKRHVNTDKFKKSMIHVICYLIVYITLAVLFGGVIAVYVLPAFALSLIWKELVILTQHSHVEIPVSEGENVKPIANMDQVPYTRSFHVNSWVAHYFLFNFNLHEAHHAHPGLPAYWLRKVELDAPRGPKYFTWFVKAKSLKGEDYIFRTSKHTGEHF